MIRSLLTGLILWTCAIQLPFLLDMGISGTVYAKNCGSSTPGSIDKYYIHGNGVGPICLDTPIPRSIMQDLKDPDRSYFATYIADGIVFEGFRLGNPPVLAGIARGPLFMWEKNRGPHPRPGTRELGYRAVRMGRLPVKMIVIDRKGVYTLKGIGVGSRLAQIKQAYNGVKIHKVPPTFGKDLCSVSVPELRNVYFYFKDCRAAEKKGRVVRIMIFK